MLLFYAAQYTKAAQSSRRETPRTSLPTNMVHAKTQAPPVPFTPAPWMPPGSRTSIRSWLCLCTFRWDWPSQAGVEHIVRQEVLAASSALPFEWAQSFAFHQRGTWQKHTTAYEPWGCSPLPMETLVGQTKLTSSFTSSSLMYVSHCLPRQANWKWSKTRPLDVLTYR